jgi:ribosomal protein L32
MVMPFRDDDDILSDYCPKCGAYTGGDSICPNCGATIFDDSGLSEDYDEEDEGGGGGGEGEDEEY